MAYEYLAKVYDRLMYETGTDYELWADYLEELFREYNAPGKTILDLGCGTGELSLKLIERGYSLLGVDISAEMLEVFRTKAEEKKIDVSLFCQDMCELKIEDKVEIIISCFDTFNYLRSLEDITKALTEAEKILLPGGIMIFDLNSEYKLRELYGNEVYSYLEDDFAYIWDNSFDFEQRECVMEITFFVKEGSEDCYRRIEELHLQKAYYPEEIKRAIDQSGLELLAVYADLEKNAPDEESEKHFYICRKKF